MGKQALNAARMKERNYSRFFKELRIQPMTRAEIARQMGLTRAAISIIAEDMLSTGIIKEGPLTYQGHYSSKALFWNKDFSHVGGINLGRDAITISLTDFCGTEIDAFHFPTGQCETGKEAVCRAGSLLGNMIAKHNPSGTFLGIGVASPGPLDTRKGIIHKPPYFDIMWDCPVSPLLRDQLHCDVVLENDANALAMAECCYGTRDRYERFLELMVDMGIGASLILDGKLNTGPVGFGNGLGHTSIDINGPLCDCGNDGCLEMYASLPRIVEAAKKADPALSSWKAIVDGAYEGQPPALGILHSEARYLGTAIVSASNLLDIDAVIFAGEHVLYRPQMLLSLVEQEVNRRTAFRSERSVTILPSQIAGNAKVLSCTNLIIERYMERPFVFSNSTRYVGKNDAIT